MGISAGVRLAESFFFFFMLKEGKGRELEYLPPTSRHRSCVRYSKPRKTRSLVDSFPLAKLIYLQKIPSSALPPVCLPSPLTRFKPCVLTFSPKPIAAGTASNCQKQLCSAKCSDLVHCCTSICVSKLNVLD